MSTIKSKDKLSTFHVNAKILVDTTISIEAKDLEDAVQKSRSLSISDFVTILEDHNDSDMRIEGVHKIYSPTELQK